MKNAVLIASRLNVLEVMNEFSELRVVKLFVQKDSLLHKRMGEVRLPNAAIYIFDLSEKDKIISEIMLLDFDILFSNGCPFILPVDNMRRPGRLFINVHPTLLPELKGKTPLSGVFITHQKFIGATMHYIDSGIDTGAIITQESVRLTKDIDQGLVYKISFDLERVVFAKGMKLLQKNNYLLEGSPQKSKGSYFNRTDELQTINIRADSTNLIIDKVKSFGIKTQGTKLKIGKKLYIIYMAEKIVNDFLLSKYNGLKSGDIAFEYDGRIVVRTIDGMIKLIDYDTKIL